MKKNSKRLKQLKNLIKEDFYPLDKGISLLKEIGTAKFLESVEAHISLNIDPKYANQQLRTSLVLPHGTGKNLKIAVFTEPDYVSEALKLGAIDYVIKAHYSPTEIVAKINQLLQ